MLNNAVLFLFVVVFGAASISSALEPPKEFVLCRRSDPHFGKCLARAVQTSIHAIVSGNKQLGVPVLDQLEVSSIHIEGNGGPVDLTQQYTDCVITGPADAAYTYAEAALEKDNCYLRFKVITDVTMTCQYVFNGKMMLFQLNGYGHANITISNQIAWHNLTCSIYEKDGNEYLKIIDWVEEHFSENIFYDFENLVDGNAEMSAHVLQFINSNAQDVYRNVKSDYEKSYAVIYKSIANKVFDKIPWKDIFLE